MANPARLWQVLLRSRTGLPAASALFTGFVSVKVFQTVFVLTTRIGRFDFRRKSARVLAEIQPDSLQPSETT